MIRAFVILLLNLMSLVRSTLRSATRLIPRRGSRPRRYVSLKLPSGVELAGKARKFGPLTLGLPARGTWWIFDELIRRISRDRDIEGVIFEAGDKGPSSLVEAGAVADRMAELRRAGKRVVAHMDQGMVKDYVVASAADTITMTPPGRLYTFGSRIEMTFLGDALEKVGVKAQFVNLGRYKTASHRFTRKAITRPQQIMMKQLAHGLSQHIVDRISRRRGMPPERARELFERAPLSAREARRRGFIDRALYSDDLKNTLQQEADCERKVQVLSAEQYMASPEPFRWRPLRPRAASHVAVLELKGMILQGNEGGLTGQLRNALTPKPVIKALKALHKDKSVKAIVLRIDSPGGSALASDLMWRQIRAVAADKPVIASLGNVAGSGGYYIAVACDEIVAHPESITGSIGVIAGKLSGGDLIKRLGVRIDHVDAGDESAFMSLTSALSDGELENLQRDIRAFYRRFLHRVSIGRKMPRRKVHRLGRGRVFTGSRAKAVGLVDHLGDLETAIEIACRKADLDREKVTLRFVDHNRPTLKDVIPGAQAAADAPSVAATVAADLIPDSLQEPVAAALLLQRGAALTLMPWRP